MSGYKRTVHNYKQIEQNIKNYENILFYKVDTNKEITILYTGVLDKIELLDVPNYPNTVQIKFKNMKHFHNIINALRSSNITIQEDVLKNHSLYLDKQMLRGSVLIHRESMKKNNFETIPNTLFYKISNESSVNRHPNNNEFIYNVSNKALENFSYNNSSNNNNSNI
jgi:hypothetical protein